MWRAVSCCRLLCSRLYWWELEIVPLPPLTPGTGGFSVALGLARCAGLFLLPAACLRLCPQKAMLKMGRRARGSALGVLFLEVICLPARRSSGCSRGALAHGRTLLLYRGLLKIFFQSQGWQGQLARKLSAFPKSFTQLLLVPRDVKQEGPQDVQDADKINMGELSVSYHQLYFTFVLDFTEHKTQGLAPWLLSLLSSPKLPKLEYYMLNRRQQ